MYYEIDWSKLSCKKKRLDTSFVPMHVPKDAKLMGQIILGSSSSWGMGVLVNNWYGDLPNNGKTVLLLQTLCHFVLWFSRQYGWTFHIPATHKLGQNADRPTLTIRSAALQTFWTENMLGVLQLSLSAHSLLSVLWCFMCSGTYSTVFTEIGCIPLTFTAYTPASGWTTIRWALELMKPQEHNRPY